MAPSKSKSKSKSTRTTPDDMTISTEWTHNYCLTCDRQIEVNVAYCSERCRVAEYDDGSRAGSEATSPSSPDAAMSWTATSRSKPFYLPPAYDFKAHKTSSVSYAATSPQTPSVLHRQSTYPAARTLTPSSSQSSLISMQSAISTSSVNDPTALSDNARKALRAYASSFDQSRYSRRPSH